jgi:chaperonin GroES
MTIRPLGDKIVISVIGDAEQTSGGIFIPDSAKEKSQKGKVIAVGSGKTNDKGEKEPMEVKVGEIVLFAKYAGTDVKVADETLKILAVSDVLGILE